MFAKPTVHVPSCHIIPYMAWYSNSNFLYIYIYRFTAGSRFDCEVNAIPQFWGQPQFNSRAADSQKDLNSF